MNSYPRRMGRERGLRLGCLAWVLACLVLRCGAPPPGAPEEETAAQPDRIDRIDRLARDFFGDGSYPSLVVGVVEDSGLVYARALGVADRATGRQARIDTIYEIGSVGKTLTASVLAILHDRGVMGIDDPLERWLPKNVQITPHPDQTSPLTMEHLATHTSGLPNIPANVSDFPTFQWRGYSTEMLFDELRQTELLHPPGTDFLYSNVGMGLLGHLMARASGTTYEQLVEDELLRPLGMTDTAIELDEEQRTRYAVGYETETSTAEAPYWEYGVLAGCGSHRSTVPDLARYLTAQWQGPSGRSLARSTLAELHRPRWRSDDGETVVALGWFVTDDPELGTMLGHRGRTAGHGAFVGFVPERKAGVIVLANRGGREANIRLAELGERLLRALWVDRD